MRIRAKIEIPKHFRALRVGENFEEGDMTLGGRWFEEIAKGTARNGWTVMEGELVIRRVRAKSKRRKV